MNHWTYPLIGLPWEPGANGPKAFYCWGLVRFVARLRLGLDMPEVQVGSEANINVAAISQAAHAGGWRQVNGDPAENDVVLMQGPVGRHVGYMVAVDQKLSLLHCNGRMTPRGPTGCVMRQPLRDVACDGYSNFELWRRAA